MGRAALWLGVAAVTAVLTMQVALWAVPRVIMEVAMARLEALAGVNAILHTPPPDHTARTVVRPSPDLAYSICVFDLSEGPVRVIADYPEGIYWSISAYGDNTDNFYVANDGDFSGAPVRVVFGKDALEGEVIEAPSTRGVILLRHHIASPAALTEIDVRRQNSACQSLVR